MLTVAYLLLVIGGLALLVGGVLVVVAAFRINRGWGLVVLFLSWLIIPLVVFALRYWSKARTGLVIALVGFILSGLGWFVFLGSEAMTVTEQLSALSEQVSSSLRKRPWPSFTAAPRS